MIHGFVVVIRYGALSLLCDSLHLHKLSYQSCLKKRLRTRKHLIAQFLPVLPAIETVPGR